MIHPPFAVLVRIILACAGLALASTHAWGAERHSLWSVQGRTNTLYLLGSVHFLKPSEQLPAVMDEAYQQAEALLMEIDMDDLDPADMQAAALELGMLPSGQTLEQRLGPELHAKVAAKAREVGLDPALLDRFQPWLAAMTLVQLHLVKLGLDPNAGVEQRLTARAVSDSKPIEGLETLRQQLGMLAALPEEQQREFLLYSVEDTERATREIDQMLTAWRRGDAQALEDLLAEGLREYPDLYRPLTVERNRRWIARIEQLLDDREDYLIVVGTLHLVGTDSVLELLARKGHKVRQH